MSNQNAHLSSFTSIISLLAVKHPQSKNQFSVLRTAVTQWYNSMSKMIQHKNTQIINAKTKGNQQLQSILQEMGHYLHTMGQYYNDPNLNIFKTKFKKIKEEFEFSHLDLNRFMDNYGTKQVQTDPLQQFLPGFDMNKLIKLLEERQEQNKYLRQKVDQLQAEIEGLRQHLQVLQNERRNQQNQYADKLNKLRTLLQSNKKQQSHLQLQPTYRSYPQVRRLSPEKKVSSRVRQAFEQAQNDQIQLNKYQKQQHDSYSKQLCLRSLLSQALAIEGILVNFDQHQKA